MKEEQLREDQRREALARGQEPASEETVPPRTEFQQPAPASAPMPEPVRAEVPMREAPMREAPVREASVREAPQPRIDPKQLLESAGLVMIETDRSKGPAPVPVEEPQHLGRPRRERPRPPAHEEEQLQQVETKR